MATTIGTEYDHIDITNGVQTIRHPLKDASARENLVKVHSELKSALAITNNEGKCLLKGEFVRGNLSSGVLNTNYQYRVSSKDIISYDRDIHITVSNDFAGVFIEYDAQGNYTGVLILRSIKTGTLPANQRFRVCIQRMTEDTSEIADINEFASQITIKTIYTDRIDSIDDEVGSLGDDMDKAFEIRQTPQMFNKDETPGNLYIKSTNEIVTNTAARSWIIPITPGKRYVAYLKQTLVGNGDNFVISTTNELPASGVYAVRRALIIRHSAGHGDFTAGETEHYMIINASGNFDNLLTNVERYGIEQIDIGDDYSGKPYGTEVYLKAEVTAENVTENEALAIVEKSGYTPQNKWQGKKIWWCGTSIPHGQDQAIGSEGSGLTYPEMVGELLGATVFNEAEGSSMARANVRTGDYVNAMSYNLLLSLSQTAEEKEYIISNWETVRQALNDPNTFATLPDNMIASARAATFEERLMPYIDGTNPMPDLFVFDHGHNDWKSFYTMPDGTTPDTELQPTVANISGNILAEDTYMTANNNAKLLSFYGEISAIPSSKRADFIASVNRNCFIGAINFLCTLILSKNPRARIVFIGNLDNWQKPQVQPAQEAIANSWGFPLIKMWEYLGFSGHYIPNTATFWDNTGTTDLTMKQIYCKDGVHPHSDTTGDTMEIYAQTIANALRNIV